MLTKIIIKKPNTRAMQITKMHLDNLVKPIGSLGKLEDFAVQLSGITSKTYNLLDQKVIVVFGADNGIWAQGITPVPQSVTATQMVNMANGVAGVAVLAKQFNIDLHLINIGVKDSINNLRITNANLMRSTNDITKHAAMSKSIAEKALNYGFNLAKTLSKQGYKTIGVGEMGICNTATSTAMLCVFSGKSAEEIAGLGAGIDRAHFAKKTDAIRRAIAINKPNANDAIDVLAKVGGLDIAGMAGVFLGGASLHIPMVIDGYISMVAALTAYRINPLVKHSLFASHQSAERGYLTACKAIGLATPFNLDMRLGEGSGCPFTMMLLDSSQRIVNDMVTFAKGNVKSSDYIDIRNLKEEG